MIRKTILDAIPDFDFSLAAALSDKAKKWTPPKVDGPERDTARKAPTKSGDLRTSGYGHASNQGEGCEGDSLSITPITCRYCRQAFSAKSIKRHELVAHSLEPNIDETFDNYDEIPALQTTIWEEDSDSATDSEAGMNLRRTHFQPTWLQKDDPFDAVSDISDTDGEPSDSELSDTEADQDNASAVLHSHDMLLTASDYTYYEVRQEAGSVYQIDNKDTARVKGKTARGWKRHAEGGLAGNEGQPIDDGFDADAEQSDSNSAISSSHSTTTLPKDKGLALKSTFLGKQPLASVNLQRERVLAVKTSPEEQPKVQPRTRNQHEALIDIKRTVKTIVRRKQYSNLVEHVVNSWGGKGEQAIEPADVKEEYTYEELVHWSSKRLRACLKSLGLSYRGCTNRRQMVERLITRGRPIDEVCEEAGRGLAELEGDVEDNYPDDESLVKYLALSLACTEEFHELMGGTILDPSCIRLSRDWLSNVHVSGRYALFNSFQDWITQGFRLKKGQKLETRVIAEAQCLYRELPEDLKVKGTASVLSFQPDPQLSSPFREDIFRYHEMRRRLLRAEKRLHQQQYEIRASTPRLALKIDQHVLEKLYNIQLAQKECSDALSSSVLEPGIIQNIDWLTETLDQNELESPASLADLERMSRQTFQKAIASICAQHSFNIKYLLPQIRCSPIWQMAPKTFPLKEAEYQTSVESTLWLHGTLIDHAHRLKDKLRYHINGVDRERFKTNMRFFLGIQERQSHLDVKTYIRPWQRRRGRRSDFFQSSDLRPSELLKDNVLHAKQLFETLVAENRGINNEPNRDLNAPRKTWTRMLGLLALLYGLIDEPAYILSASEKLLQELSACFGKFGWWNPGTYSAKLTFYSKRHQYLRRYCHDERP